MSTLSKTKTVTRLGPVILAYAAFVALGMPDGLLGIAWPTMRLDFGVPLDAVGMLLVASVTGYMTSSFLSGALVSRFSVGQVLAVSCMLTGAALIGYTFVPQWWMMVLLGVVAGLGAGAIDAGMNTYAAAHFGEGLVQWLHASYGIGITLGPIIITTALTTFDSWRLGYRVVGGFQFVMALAFFFTLAWWSDHRQAPADGPQEKKLTDYKTPMGETVRRPRVWLSVSLFFLYVGAEVSLGIWAYSLLTESRGIEPRLAGLLTGSYWAMFTVGRILAGLYAKRLGVNTLVQGSLALALSGALLLWWNPFPMSNLIAVALVGFAIAPIFPALISGTSQRVGAHLAANTIGMQMAVTGLGASVIPSLVGVLARRFSLEIVPVILVLLFLTLLGLYRLAIMPRAAAGGAHVG